MISDVDPVAHLSDRARTHADLAKDARPARDAAIYDAYTAGATYDQLAARAGMSRTAIYQAVNRECARRQLLDDDDEAE